LTKNDLKHIFKNMNPFSPLFETVEFQARIGDMESSESKVEAFLVSAYKMFIAYGLPTSLNGVLRTITEESSLSSEGGVEGDWSYAGTPKDTFILLNQPIYELVSVKIKDQTSTIPNFSPEIPTSVFQFLQYQKYLETSYYNFTQYKAQYFPLQSYAKFVQVVYKSGVPLSAKDNFLEALFLIYLDIGLDSNPDLVLNEGRIKSYEADDTTKTYDWSEVTTTKNYMQNNPDVASILNQYRSSDKHIF
jgi:hypothetical protein